jgi:hypothetical protein
MVSSSPWHIKNFVFLFASFTFLPKLGMRKSVTYLGKLFRVGKVATKQD